MLNFLVYMIMALILYAVYLFVKTIIDGGNAIRKGVKKTAKTVKKKMFKK